MLEPELKHLTKSFELIRQAMDAAMQQKFPVGLDAIDLHMEIKSAMLLISMALKEAYEDKIKALDEPSEQKKDN